MDRANQDDREEEEEEPGVLMRMGSRLSSILWYPISFLDALFPPIEPASHPLADRCALLFLVLVQQAPLAVHPDQQPTNP